MTPKKHIYLLFVLGSIGFTFVAILSQKTESSKANESHTREASSSYSDINFKESNLDLSDDTFAENKTGFDRLLTLIKGPQSIEKTLKWQFTLAELTRTDPEKAFELVSNITPLRKRSDALDIVVEVAGNHQQHALLSLIENSGWTLSEKLRLRTKYYSGWGATNPQSALSSLKTIHSQKEKHALEKSIVSTWSQKEPRSVLNWIEARPPNSTTVEYYHQAFEALIEQEPLTAANLINDFEDYGYGYQNYLAADTAVALTQTSGADESLEWASNLKSKNFRQAAYQGALAELTRSSPESALETLSSPQYDFSEKTRRTTLQWIARYHPEKIAKDHHRLQNDYSLSEVKIIAQEIYSLDAQLGDILKNSTEDREAYEAVQRIAIHQQSITNPQKSLPLFEKLFQMPSDDNHQMDRDMFEFALEATMQIAPDFALSTLTKSTIFSPDEKAYLHNKLLSYEVPNLIIPDNP